MKRKILAAFVLTLIAIGMALTIAHFSFNEMMVTVEQLSAPNEKLVSLNKVFEEVTMLDQQQRAEAIRNPQKPYKYFLDQTGFLRMMIDSLQMLEWDSVQHERLAALPDILDQRNQLFVAYLKVKAELADNKDFSKQLDTLSVLLEQGHAFTDSIVTTQRQTITRYIARDSVQGKTRDRGFLKKIFGKKKEKIEKAPVQVKEELNVTIDTLSMAHSGLDVADIQKRMRELESDQRMQRKLLQEKELELIHANSLFINQLLNTLHEVENEELRHMQYANDTAAEVVNDGISRMHIVMLSFFLATALLGYLILVDISKSNYYRMQLEKARDHAEELTKIKQRFLANMSHEIRTPLQSIIGFAEQLRQERLPNTEAVDAIHSSSEHLLQIVNEVLDYSRISSGSLTLSQEQFKLLAVVKEVEAAMRIQAQRKKLAFILDTEKAYAHVLVGDSFRLRQILYNLIGNAIKFTHQGFVKLTLLTYASDNDVECVFEITDTGIGMTSEEIGRIFNQFEQANHQISKSYGGTGLGLSIVKSLVEAQHGKLEVSSSPGAGSIFKVILRFAKAQITETPNGGDNFVRRDSSRTKVLLIDDDPMIIKLCSVILTKNRIRHQTFQHPHKLIEKEVDDTVTHILIDIRMPDINGIELCQALHDKYPPTTRFIALTAHVLPEQRDDLLRKGFDQVLPKPFHERQLLQSLRVLEAVEPAAPHDFAIVRQMTMGDEELFQSIMQQFVQETAGDLAKVQESIKTQDREKLRELVHKMAGRFGQMGLNMLSVRYHDLEVALVKGDAIDSLSGELSSVVHETRLLLDSIRQTQNV
ncbi:MAG TPA: ATP-binding protein [Chryseosolibacter sp.]|nr:ATP-binding protein [Chryseosolibacter sp.]